MAGAKIQNLKILLIKVRIMNQIQTRSITKILTSCPRKSFKMNPMELSRKQLDYYCPHPFTHTHTHTRPSRFSAFFPFFFHFQFGDVSKINFTFREGHSDYLNPVPFQLLPSLSLLMYMVFVLYIYMFV